MDVLQSSLLHLMLPVLHVQIRRHSRGFACHLSLALPHLATTDSLSKIVAVHVTSSAIFLVAAACLKSAFANGLATASDSLQGIPLLLSDGDSLQRIPSLQSDKDLLQRIPSLHMRQGFASRDSLSPKRQRFASKDSPSPKRQRFASGDSHSPKRRRFASGDSDSPQRQHSSRASSGGGFLERPPSGSSPTRPSSPPRKDKEAEESAIPAPVRAMIDFILKSFPDAQASPSHPSSRSFDLSAYAGVTDATIPPGLLLAWCHALSDAFSDTQQRFARRIKDGKVCHTLLPTLNRFERVSNSPTQGKELKPNPDVLDLLRNRVPDNRHVPLSLKGAAALERSLRSGLESHNFLTWSVVALIRSLHEKKLLPKDDPVISQLQKSFSKACGNLASCMTSSAAFVTLKRRQLLLSHVVPSVSDAQKRNLLSDPFFQTSSLFSAAFVEAARSAARDLSLFKPHLKASSSRRPANSSSSAQRGPARSSSRQSSAQRSSSPLRQQSGKKGDSHFQKKSSGPHQKRGGFRR